MTAIPSRQHEVSTADLLAHRARVLSPTYKLFFQEPVNLVRAEGLWMFDNAGERYLDMYNNVPVVGHCHPHVVEAMARQATLINTHTRYLHGSIIDLADRLLATTPRSVDQMVFTCTGSEANDLAYRIAKVVTRGTGFIVTENAYHGVTAAVSGLSPQLRSGEGPGPNVYLIPVPTKVATDHVQAQFTAGVADALARMRTDNVRPAALLIDTIFASDGVLSDPAGFLRPAADLVRDEGGVVIADEVQPGFGRLGSGMWGFERHGIEPDIITMGKPMGNGHPIAALAARRDLLARFGRVSGYFNTFGGNTVSAAVAHAVIDVIEGEHLIENAKAMGSRLREGLIALAKKHPSIADVRGVGLYYGVDLAPVAAGVGRNPASDVINELRRRHVLVGSAGKDATSLKIRPPLPFSEEHNTYFLAQLDDALRRLATGARAGR